MAASLNVMLISCHIRPCLALAKVQIIFEDASAYLFKIQGVSMSQASVKILDLPFKLEDASARLDTAGRRSLFIPLHHYQIWSPKVADPPL